MPALEGYSHTRRLLLSAALSAALVTWAATGIWLWSSRQTILSTARDDLQRMSVIVAEQTLRLMSLADTHILAIDTILAESAGPASIDNPAVAMLTARFAEQVGGAAAMRFVDAQGFIHSSPRSSSPEGISVVDRDYFRHAGTERLTVGNPVISRLSGHWVMPTARRLRRPVDGIVVAYTSIDLGRLEGIYDTIRHPRGGAVSLFRRDGTLLARAPRREDALGKVFDRSLLMTEHLPRAPSGFFIAESSVVDGEARLVAYQSVAAYDLVVVISAIERSVLMPWQRTLWLGLAAAGAVSLLIAAGTAILLRLLRNLEGNARTLDRRVQERTAALERAVAARSLMLTSVSHELRTPLNAIIGFSDGLCSGIFGPLSELHREYIGDIHNSGVHLLAVVNDLLDTAALESGKMNFDDGEVDLAQLIAEARTMIGQRAGAVGVSVETEVAPGLPPVLADRRRLLQAVINVGANAVKYNQRGGSVRLVAGLDATGDCHIEVIDNGIGMSESDLEQALQPFGRAAHPVAQAIEGTGLGLPLAAGILKTLGGSLTIDSARGRGTTVRLTLPASRVLATARHQPETVPA